MYTLGTKPLCKRLKAGAVPSVFPHVEPEEPSQLSMDRQSRYRGRCAKKNELPLTTLEDQEECHMDVDIDAMEEVVEDYIEHLESLECNPESSSNVKEFTTSHTQTPSDFISHFSPSNFKHDPEGMNFYTGLEDYSKFQFVLQTLGEAAYHLKYYYNHVQQFSVEDQFFITLVKLRRKKTNFELSRLFGTSEWTITNIFVTWINFMYRQWKEVNIWPSKDLVRYYAPSDFKAKFPTTRAIVDGTECPIQKPKDPVAQQQTFSHYKNKNTAKVLVSATPGGLISDVTQSYGGAASDRQIVERSTLPTMCDPKDSLLADKGFNVQDIFALYDVQINIPDFFKKKNRLSGKTVMKDRKIASKRIHIERIIGLGKTYRILERKMNATETKMASKIIFVCYMLCNFRKNIVPTTA